MKNSPASDHFSGAAARSYDERNKALSPIADCMHFLIGLVLKDLPDKAHVLCVGVGTGAEILSLSKLYPHWTFVGVDPSASMLEVCAERLQAAGVLDRCELFHGFVQDLPEGEKFDAALSVLVAHFVKREERLSYFGNMTRRLKRGGTLVNTELSFDLASAETAPMIENWKHVQALMGVGPEALVNLPQLMKEKLSVLPPAETEDILRGSGVAMPVRFFQAFMMCGWYGTKR
jgi:tRNA (cmo5U34)-methyltransferase